jgi:hypothetical protein
MKMTASKDDTAAFSSAASDTNSFLLRDQTAAAAGTGYALDAAPKSTTVAAEDCQPAPPSGWQVEGSSTEVPEGPSELTGLDLFSHQQQQQQQDAALMEKQQQLQEEKEGQTVPSADKVLPDTAAELHDEDACKHPSSIESQPKQLHSTQQETTDLSPAPVVAAAAAAAATTAVAAPAALPQQPAAVSKTTAEGAVGDTVSNSDFDSQASTTRSTAAAAPVSTTARDYVARPGDLPAHTAQQQQQDNADDLPMGKIRLSAQGVAVTASANSHY